MPQSSVEADGLLIDPPPRALHGARLATHHDHRLAMAFGVLGTVVDGIEVEDPSVVTKSWPDFWQMLEHITGHPARPGERGPGVEHSQITRR